MASSSRGELQRIGKQCSLLAPRAGASCRERGLHSLAEYGWDVWTLDHEGYGRSDRTAGNSAIAEGVNDLRAGMAVVAACGAASVWLTLRENAAATAVDSRKASDRDGVRASL